MIDRRFVHEHLSQDLSKVLDKKIAICGCGAIGSNLAHSLARRGFKNFWLVDRDKIELHNISTQTWYGEDVGRFKVDTLSTRLYFISRANAVPISKDIKSQKDLKRLLPSNIDLLIDSFDNRDARATTIGAYSNVIHIGLSIEDTAEICWDEDYILPPDVALADPCAYPLSRTIVEMAVAKAGEFILDFFMHDIKKKVLVVHK